MLKTPINYFFLILSIIFLCSCSSYQSTRESKNMTALHLDKDYLEAYRIMNETLLNQCHFSAESVLTTVLPDIQTARITNSNSNVIAFSVDFIKSSGGGTDMNVYSSHSNFEWIALNMQKAINEDIKKCYWSMPKNQK